MLIQTQNGNSDCLVNTNLVGYIKDAVSFQNAAYVQYSWEMVLKVNIDRRKNTNETLIKANTKFKT